MKRHLFLSGAGFSGKSALIRSVLGPGLEAAGGFCTELSPTEIGGLLGCTLFPAAAAAGAEGFEKELFLDLRTDPVRHDSEVFRGTGVRLLEEAQYYPYAVLDEIGGMDLIIPQFRTALDALLSSELPILGVVKTKEECENLRRLLGPGERFSAFWDRLYGMLAVDPDTQIIEVGGDAGTAKAAAEAWAAEYADISGL